MTMTHLRSIDRRLHYQRGGVAIWFALLLPVLLGFAALAVDLARLHLVKVELQSAADAAAMGGARSLTDAGGDPFNWAAAEAKALELAQQNVANGAPIQNATIETGYWNLQSRSWSSTFVTGYLPAVRATIAISDTQNNGPLNLLFAPVLGIADSNVEASATAVIAPPAGGTGLFPFVIGMKMLDHFWDINTSSPVLVNGVAPTINLGSIYTFDGEKVLSGQWTTFQSNVKNPDVPFMRDLIDNGNATELSIGDNTYIQPGAKATLYREVPVGTTVGMFIVDEVDTNAFVPIVAIAAFHIDGYSQGGKYITGHFVDAAIIPGLEPGDGSGGLYGAYTPPILVK
jgi:Flp pilus assembly protein TadG